MNTPLLFAAALVLTTVASSCSKKAAPTTAAPHASGNAHAHEHKAPHGGTAVVLGQEAYHLEFVLDRSVGKLSAYVLDGHMDKYIRIAAPSFEMVATVQGAKQTLTFQAVADSATGEKIGDTSLFETTADWLKTAATFDAVITRLEIRGTTFADIVFNFPRGNDRTNPH